MGIFEKGHMHVLGDDGEYHIVRDKEVKIEVPVSGDGSASWMQPEETTTDNKEK